MHALESAPNLKLQLQTGNEMRVNDYYFPEAEKENIQVKGFQKKTWTCYLK